MGRSICGIWVADDGIVRLSLEGPDGARREEADALRPFAWLRDKASAEGKSGITVEELAGAEPFKWLAHAATFPDYEALQAAGREGGGVDTIRALESQFLLERRERLFEGVPFTRLRRCQLDIETASPDGGFSDASRPEDRILAIGLKFNGRSRTLVVEECTDPGEKALLEAFNQVLREEDPDVIEGHNIFKFDLDYLRQRCRRLKVPCAWGRFGQKAAFRPSRMKAAERWIDFPRCDLPGRTVVDTCLLVQLYDITAREMPSYGLKESSIYFGITPEDGGGRTYIPGPEICATFQSNRERFLAYLEDDLRETKAIADLLLPTYVEQARTFPILLQEATLRGITGKIDLLFLEQYYHGRHSCPVPPEIRPFEGGYTRSFREGVFRHVLHFDVASLYPSLLLHIGRNPRNDPLGVFIPLLRSLREYRLKYKELAKNAPKQEERDEAQARQASFKILINSFYGYLGFSGARFGDGELAAEVTRRGRELLQRLIDAFAAEGCTILEADTDGIYLSSPEYFGQPEKLLKRVEGVLPEGIELEYDGRYEAMFCYKAKNYALYDGKKIILRGSALRSRGIEPYLQELGDRFIHFLLGATKESPVHLVEVDRQRLLDRSMPVEQLAKSETLSQNPDAYEGWVALGGKPRRASAEAALQLNPRPRMGDRVTYYVTMGKGSDWQRARPISLYDPVKAPYDVAYYADKLEDWVKRYGAFLDIKPAGGVQGELF